MADQNSNYQNQLRDLGLNTFLAEEKQRKKIASDLHDHVGQALAMLKFKLGKLKGDAVFCGFDSDIDDMRKLIDQIITYTRELTVELSPPIIHELGFSNTMVWLKDQMAKKYQLQISLKDEANVYIYDDALRLALFRSIQEILINTVKHAKTSEASLNISRLNEELVIKIEDQGQGFSSEMMNTSGYGLFSIKERMQTLGGTFEIHSVPNVGTKTIFKIKLNETEHTHR